MNQKVKDSTGAAEKGKCEWRIGSCLFAPWMLLGHQSIYPPVHRARYCATMKWGQEAIQSLALF